MKMHFWILVLLSAQVGQFARGPQTQVDAEAKLQALERLWGSAAQLRDTKALDSIFDNSLAYVHIDGRLMTKAEVLADTKAVSPVDIVLESSKAFSHGNVVIVTGLMRLKGIRAGKPFVQHGRFLDAWVQRDGSWVCISSMSTPIKP